MKIISISDLHIWNDMRLQKNLELQAAIKREYPDILVIDGDFDDPAECSQAVIRLTQTYRSWQSFIADLIAQGKTVYRVRGNHDPDPPEEDFHGVTIVSKLIFHYPFDMEFRHGYEYDWIWGGCWWFPGIANATFWLLGHYPKMIRWINDMRHLFSRKSPRDEKGTTQQDWNDHVASIHNKARKQAIKTGRMQIIGHTHCPYMDSMIADCGDFEDSFSYLSINGGDIAIKYIKEIPSGKQHKQSKNG